MISQICEQFIQSPWLRCTLSQYCMSFLCYKCQQWLSSLRTNSGKFFNLMRCLFARPGLNKQLWLIIFFWFNLSFYYVLLSCCIYCIKGDLSIESFIQPSSLLFLQLLSISICLWLPQHYNLPQGWKVISQPSSLLFLQFMSLNLF